jgi:acyl carrier protein
MATGATSPGPSGAGSKLRDELRAELCRLIFGEPVPESELSDDDDLFAAGLDSMGMLKAVAWLEKRLGRELPANALKPENFKTVRTLAGYVAAL